MAVIFCSRIPRGSRGGNRTKVHGVVVVESDRGGGGMGFAPCFNEGGPKKWEISDFLSVGSTPRPTDQWLTGAQSEEEGEWGCRKILLKTVFQGHRHMGKYVIKIVDLNY